jgi:hypothetical protein
MSSQKLANNNNALKHGGTSQKLFLPDENQSDFEALLESLKAEYNPETEQHQLFIEQLATAHWLLRRRQQTYNAIEAAAYASVEHNPENLDEAQFHRLALAERYKVAAERALKRALANAEFIRKSRKSDEAHRDRHARWQAAQLLRERRLQITEAKHKAAEAREADQLARELSIRNFLRPEVAGSIREQLQSAAERARRAKRRTANKK